MATCTFFGHREVPEDIDIALGRVILELIFVHHVDNFYVGNQGMFDQAVLRVLRALKREPQCPPFDYAVVQAYFPDKRPVWSLYQPEETILPEGQELVHPKFAIAHRNDWMLKHSDWVVAFVRHDWGGAARYLRKARRMGKAILEIELGPAEV